MSFAQSASDLVIGKRMRLVRFYLILSFTRKTPSPGEKVFRAIGGKGLYTGPEQQASVRLNNERLQIAWESDECRIVLEDADALQDCVEVGLSWLSRINSASPIGRVNKIQLTTSWLLPAPNDTFASLEQKYRATMAVIRESIMEGTVDSSIMFDAQIGDWALHHQSGPMEPNQLQERFLSFEPDEVPEVFLFLMFSISDQNMLQYTEENMRGRLTALFDHCKSHSDAFGQIWEGSL